MGTATCFSQKELLGTSCPHPTAWPITARNVLSWLLIPPPSKDTLIFQAINTYPPHSILCWPYTPGSALNTFLFFK